jgi:hypothetical protein
MSARDDALRILCALITARGWVPQDQDAVDVARAVRIARQFDAVCSAQRAQPGERPPPPEERI